MADFGNILTIDARQLRTEADKLTRAVLGVGADSVRASTRNLERKFEDVTRGAVGGKLWRAWSSEAFPRTGPAKDPAGTVFLKGGARTRGAVDFFTKPGRIVGKRGQFLAIPTAAAGPRGRARDLTPGEWERRNGARLRFVYRRGRPSLLVLDEGVLSGKGKIGRLNSEKRRATGRGNTTVVIFVLMPVVNFANRFAIEPMVKASEGELAREFFERVRSLNGR
ncbi:hypothetical protein ACFB49_42510 [Sphingomonas sp. DBB INV C78]|uniref:DUF6441 family protein n=1 Tax=Sphingomonas sp. DBB INV C78 TaxID=3349434 RepID=UPI0036D2B634